MALRRINHYRRIISRQLVSFRIVRPGDFIEFGYKSENNFDKKPLVFVLDIFSGKNLLNGINLNYLQEREVQLLFEEPDYKKIQRGAFTRSTINTAFKKLRYWSFYEKAFRSYSISKMSTRINEIEYKTNEMLAIERQERRDANKL